MRVLVLNWKDVSHPNAGGAEVYTERVAARLVELGHAVTLFVAAVDGHPERELRDGYEIVRRGGRLTVYREARRFWETDGDGRFDVVVDEVNTRPFLTPRYVRSAPVVALIHQVAREVWRYEVPPPFSWLGRYVLEPRWLRLYADVPVMTVSASSAASLKTYGIHAPIVVPEGSDPVERPDVAREERPTVVFLGRLAANKRPDHALAAFDVLKAARADAQMWVMGDGPMRARLAAKAPADVEVRGHVPFDERQRRLAAAHVLVATSVREGWGLNVSEAAAMGTPTLGYDVDGLRDSVPASGGALVPPSPEALGRALIDLFDGRIALQARPSTVPWAQVGDAVERVLLDAIERRSEARR